MHRVRSIKRIKNGGSNKISRSLKRLFFGTTPNPLTKGKSSHTVKPGSNNNYEWETVNKQLSDKAKKAETQRIIEHSVGLYINSNNAADLNDIYKFITTNRYKNIPFIVTKSDPYFTSAHWINIQQTRNFSNLIPSNEAKKAKKANNAANKASRNVANAANKASRNASKKASRKAAKNAASKEYRNSRRAAMKARPPHSVISHTQVPRKFRRPPSTA